MTVHGGEVQTFVHADRPHAVATARGGAVSYAYDDDGNVEAITESGSSRYMAYDASNRLTCFRSTPTGPCDRTIHYDVDGQRELEDEMANYAFTAFVSPSIRVRQAAAIVPQTELEVMAFGERIALKTSTETIRTAGLFEWVSPPAKRIILVASASGCGALLIVLLARNAAVLVLIARRPGRSTVTIVLVVGQAFLNVPPAWAGGGAGGEATRYFELADRLGSGMIMLDETGALDQKAARLEAEGAHFEEFN